MSSHPHIIAETAISTTALSFTSGPEPQLKMIITLTGAERPITFSKRYHSIFITPNAFIIDEVPSGREVYRFFVEKCYRSSRPLQLNDEHADDFVTLEPGIPYEVHNLGFRPLGVERNSQRIPSAPENHDAYRKYAFLNLGMNWLDPGKEYLIKARPGLQIWTWRWGKKEELMPCEWYTSDGDPLDILPSEGIQVRVEE